MSTKITNAMLMAAGLGTRLRPFTNFLPKPFLPVMGIPMAQFAIDQLRTTNVERVVANIHHLPELARCGLGDLDWTLNGRAQSLRYEISDESSLLLGSAGGLKKAQKNHFTSEPFFLINGDVLCDIDLGRLEHHHHRLRQRWGVWMTMTLFRKGPSGGKYREIFFDPATELVTSAGDLQEGRPYFVGVAVIEPEALQFVPEEGPSEFVPTILNPAIQAGKVGVHLAEGEWHDIGSCELWLKTHLELIRRLETGKLSSGWRERIESVNARIASEIWVSRAADDRLHPGEWAGPCYWSPLNKEGAPKDLGPRAVLYGSEISTHPSRNGIGYRGEWVSNEA